MVVVSSFVVRLLSWTKAMLSRPDAQSSLYMRETLGSDGGAGAIGACSGATAMWSLVATAIAAPLFPPLPLVALVFLSPLPRDAGFVTFPCSMAPNNIGFPSRLPLVPLRVLPTIWGCDCISFLDPFGMKRRTSMSFAYILRDFFVFLMRTICGRDGLCNACGDY